MIRQRVAARCAIQAGTATKRATPAYMHDRQIIFGHCSLLLGLLDCRCHQRDGELHRQ